MAGRGSGVAVRYRAQGNKLIGVGVLVFVLGILTLVLELPIIWIGGFLVGLSLVYRGVRMRAVAGRTQPIRPQAPLDAVAAASGGRCGNCGTDNPPGSQFCTGCGRPLGT